MSEILVVALPGVALAEKIILPKILLIKNDAVEALVGSNICGNKKLKKKCVNNVHYWFIFFIF